MRENCRQTFRSLVTDNLVLYLISLYCCTTATGDAVLPDVQRPYQQQIQSQYQAEQITSNLFYLYFCPIKKTISILELWHTVTYRSHLENFPCSYTYKHVRCPIFKFNSSWAVVVAQLAERLLLTPEARSSNPVIGNNLNWICCQMYLKDKIKVKEAENGP